MHTLRSTRDFFFSVDDRLYYSQLQIAQLARVCILKTKNGQRVRQYGDEIGELAVSVVKASTIHGHPRLRGTAVRSVNGEIELPYTAGRDAQLFSDPDNDGYVRFYF